VNSKGNCADSAYKEQQPQNTINGFFALGISFLGVSGGFLLALFMPKVASLPEAQSLAITGTLALVIGVLLILLGIRKVPKGEQNPQTLLLGFVITSLVFQYFFMPDIIGIYFGAK